MKKLLATTLCGRALTGVVQAAEARYVLHAAQYRAHSYPPVDSRANRDLSRPSHRGRNRPRC